MAVELSHREEDMANKADITWRPNVEQTAITTSGSSQQSAAFASETYAIRLGVYAATATFGIQWSVGTNPTAGANSPFLGAGGYEYIAVTPGEKVAIIDKGGVGVCTITELTR
jgi:hypothetical protein